MTDIAGKNAVALAGFDTETTGLDVQRDRIVSGSVVGWDPDGTEAWRHDWLIDPGVAIPAEASRIHGITTEQARREGRAPDSAVEEITRLLERVITSGTPLVIQNAPYDLAMLAAEARRYAVVPLQERCAVAPVLDPVMLAKVANVPGRHSLAELSRRFGVVNARAHTAYADAVTTLGVVRRMLALPQLDEDVLTLHLMQVEAARVRAAAFEADLRVGAPCARVAARWPLAADQVRTGCTCRDCGRELEADELEQPCRECLEALEVPAS